MGKGPSSIEKKELATEPVSVIDHDQFAIDGRPGALPVLEAFQEFLEAERGRMRQRIFALTAFFSLMLLCVVGGGILVGSFFFGQTKEKFEMFRSESLKMREDTESTLKQFVVQTERIRDDMTEEIRKEHNALVDARSEIKEHANNYDNELEEIKDVFSILERENKSLKKDIYAISTEWPAMSSAVEALLAEMERLHALSPEFPVDTLKMPIIPRGKTRATIWRLPIPE